MAINQEARLVGQIDQHEQITVLNDTGAALVANEVWHKTDSDGNYVPHVAREPIASNARGEAHIFGEFDCAAYSTAVFEADDPVYWRHGAGDATNKALTRAMAKIGDRFLGYCTLAKATGTNFVRLRLARRDDGDSISWSSSTSSSSSTSTSSASTSSNSDSKSASISSNSDSSSSTSSASAPA